MAEMTREEARAARRFESSAATDAFVAELAALDVTLPLRLSEEDLGVVLDADGCDVITIDVNGDRPDNQVAAIAKWIACAVNTCGGFRAEIADHG
jgi:hypothetical protein